MSLKQKLLDDFKLAFKEKNLLKKSVLSMINSEIKNQEIELKKREEGLSDDEVIKVVMRAVKQRKDSKAQYLEGGRKELAEQEQFEISVLEEYLPEQLDTEEIEKKVKEVIDKVGAESMSDIGKVMGMVMKELGGSADGNEVKKAAEKLLSK